MPALSCLTLKLMSRTEARGYTNRPGFFRQIVIQGTAQPSLVMSVRPY